MKLTLEQRTVIMDDQLRAASKDDLEDELREAIIELEPDLGRYQEWFDGLEEFDQKEWICLFEPLQALKVQIKKNPALLIKLKEALDDLLNIQEEITTILHEETKEKHQT